MTDASTHRAIPEAISLLRVPTNFTETDLRRAKRALLFESHPDHVGADSTLNNISVDAVIAAYELLKAALVRDVSTMSRVEPKFTRDLPSFTVSSLPVDAYHLLFVAAHELGEVVEEDEPYFLVVRMTQPWDCWCEIDIVPDAGASTVSLLATQFGEATGAPLDIISVRDLWIHTINGLQTPS